MKEIAGEETEPRARTVGFIYLSYFVWALSAGVMLKGLIAIGDPTATANNIMAHQRLYQAGLAVELIGNVLYLALVALLVRLLEPVNRRVALTAVLFGAAGCMIQIVGGLFHSAPLVILSNSSFASQFAPAQLQAASMAFLRLYQVAISVALVLFAVFNLAIGYLVWRSTFLPVFLGVLMMLSGVGWLVFVWPPLAIVAFPFVMPVGILAEGALMVWLITKGVNVTKWHEVSGHRFVQTPEIEHVLLPGRG